MPFMTGGADAAPAVNQPKPGAGRASGLPKLRGFQPRAVDAIVAGLATGGRGQLLAACGSGKSLVAVHAALRLCPDGVVVLSCPSLALVAQSLRVWLSAGVVDDVLAVCSDDTVADTAVHTYDLPCPVTTDHLEVAGWLRQQQTGRLRLIVATHVSSGVAGAGLIQARTTADLLVVDEAHRTAGLAGSTFAQVHDDGYVPSRRRLYMTATPRVLAGGRSGPASDERDALSMDDEAVFGPVLLRYPFAEAIDDGWLDDYQVVAIGVTRNEVLQLLRDAAPAAVTDPGEAPLHTVVVQAALIRAAAQFGLRRVLVFTQRVQESKQFSRTLTRTATLLAPHENPKGLLTVGHVDGEQSVSQRARSLQLLADPPDGGWTVLSCARCLGEGVDVPAVDAVVFSRPKRSEVDVVQAVGRALRRHPDGSGVATVLVPVLLPDDPQHGDDLGEWATLWQVLRALRAHDGRLAAQLDTQRGRIIHGEPPQIPHQVRLRLPEGYGTEEVLRHITVRLIENTTPPWAAGYAALTAFHAAHGHVRVPRPHKVGSLDLSNWLRYQLERHRNGVLSAERADALRALGVNLDPVPDSWERGIGAARAFHAQHGHLHPPVDLLVDGINVYSWLKHRRTLDRAGRLDAEHDKTLTAMDPTWRETKRRTAWEEGLSAATAYHAQHGRLRPARQTIIHDVDVYEWLVRHRAMLHDGRLPAEHEDALNALDPTWSRRTKIDFADGLAAATAFHTEHGHLRPPQRQRIHGIILQAWLAGIRRKYHAGELNADQIAAFERLDIAWSTADTSWERGLAAATAFHARTGHLRIPRQHREHGIAIATWLDRQRKKHAAGTLPPDRIAALDHLDWRRTHEVRRP